MTDEKKGNKKRILLILIIACGISIIGNVIQFASHKEQIEVKDVEIDTLHEIKLALDNNVADAQETVKSLEGDNAELNEEVASKLAQIERIKAENDSLMKSDLSKTELNRRLKANLSLVKRLNKELENKVEELLLENKKLETENSDLQINVDVLNTITDSLSGKVAIASVLSAEYIDVTAYKKRRNKYRKTKLAKRTNKIELTFKVMKNPITENGEKTVLLKIISPEAISLGNFTKTGSISEHQANGAVKFADFKSFTYTGSEQQINLSFETEERNFPKGVYLLEVLINQKVSGTATFTLK
jgi:predicted RNase H-like nuclease (RuvC/YqgF family)